MDAGVAGPADAGLEPSTFRLRAYGFGDQIFVKSSEVGPMAVVIGRNTQALTEFRERSTFYMHRALSEK